MLAYRRASITRHAAGMQQHLLLCILVAGAASWLTPGFFFCQLQLVLLLLLLARGLGAWPACTLQLAAAAAAATGQPASPAGCEWTSAGAPAPRPSRWRCACSIAWQAQAGRGEGARTGCVAWSACTCTGRRLGCSATRQQDSQVQTVCSSHCHSWEGVEEQRLPTSTWWAHLNVWLPCTCCSRDRLVCSHCAWPCLYSCSM